MDKRDDWSRSEVERANGNVGQAYLSLDASTLLRINLRLRRCWSRFGEGRVGGLRMSLTHVGDLRLQVYASDVRCWDEAAR